MQWYYHENSDTLFVGEDFEDFGTEHEFIHLLGEAEKRNKKELQRILLQNCSWRWIYKELGRFSISY